MSKNTTYPGVKDSAKTSKYFADATAHFQNAQKATLDCTKYATEAGSYAMKVIENGYNGICAAQNFANETKSFDSALPAFAKAAISGFAGLLYCNPFATTSAAAALILYSPQESIECAKNAVKAVVSGSHSFYEHGAGLVDGIYGVCSLISDNIYGYDMLDQLALIGDSTMVAIV